MEMFCSQAYTSKGLISLVKKASDADFTYILKGYPAALKHSLLKELLNSTGFDCAAAYDYNNSPIYLYCKEKGFQIIDGTYPNAPVPETYGIADSVVDLNSFQDMRLLSRSKAEALSLFNEIRKEEKRCAGFLSAAKGIAAGCKRQENAFVIRPALNRFSARLWKKYGMPPSGRVGTETRYFADFLTASGFRFNYEKFNSMCGTVSVIEDSSAAVSESVADKIRLYALSCGFDVISFVDFLDAETVRHIIIPELEYGIYSADFSCAANIENGRKIRKSRFLKPDYSEHLKNKTAFCRKAYSELAEEAAKSIKTIEILKKRLDKIYLDATDTDSFISENALRITGIDKSLQKVYNVNKS